MNAAERLFAGFVERLEATDCRHVFLRGYQAFPSVPEGSDVDMLVAPAQRKRVEELLRESASAEGFHIWQRFRSGFITRFFAYRFDEAAGHQFFDLDLHTCEASFGIPYLSAESLLQEAIEDEGLRRLPPGLEALLNGLGQLFMGGSLSEKYRAAWSAQAHDPKARAALMQVLGEADAKRLLGSLDPAGPALLQGEGKAIGKRARRRLLGRHPLQSCLGFLSFGFGERCAPWFAPRGRFLIFAGTDGSGKTTLVREVLQRIAPRFREGVVEEHHLRPGILPQLSALFHGGQPAYSLEDMSDPHRSPPSGFIGSSLRTLYYWFDYFLGYPLRILPRRRRNALIVYDRWFYDHVVDPRRFRIAAGHPLPGFLQHFLALPDRLLVCSAPAERILERKQELTADEVERQVRQFQAFAARHPRATLIDTSHTIQQCVDRIIRSIFEDPRP